MYVARFTTNPGNDIERGWSAYFAPFETDLRKMLDFVGVDISEALEGVDEDEVEERLLELADEHNLVQDPHTGAWRPFHHDGLSCFALEASTLEDAIEEARARNLSWGGFGHATRGEVRCVCKVDGVDDLYIFECEDVVPEC